jgi:DNA polymerase-3 subunit epsilon
MSNALAFIDFETTGLSPDNGDRVIEVGIAVLEGGQIVDRYQSFIHPGKRIPYEVIALTGITDVMVRNSPPADYVMQEVMQFIGNLPLVAHNASFDRRFMDAELDRANLIRANEFVCSLRVARRVYPEARSHKLSTLVQLTGVEPADQYHRALGDAEMTAGLWMRMVDEIRTRHAAERVTLKLMRSLQTCRVDGAAGVVAKFGQAAGVSSP